MSFVLSGVTYGYRGERLVLDRLNVTIPGGQTTAVVGASGSGKTTLLNLLGLLWEGALGTGHITYAGESEPLTYDRLSHDDRARLRLREFGFVLQSCYLLPHFSCAENIKMVLALKGYGRAECDDRVARLFAGADDRQAADAGDKENELADVQGHLPGQVSGGQRQRMAVLRAVVHNPRVVFADEPVSNLDDDNKLKMIHLLRRWQGGELNPDGDGPRQRTLVLVCHDTETAYAMGDTFLILRRTREGSSYQFLTKPQVAGPDELRRLINPKAAP